MSGSHAATEFVAWYNGHPDYADAHFDLSCERAVVVGNGNVALDVARILLSDPDHLATTDIVEHVLQALRQSAVREVVVIGRRGVAQAAYTNPEMLSLLNLAGVDLVVEETEVSPDAVTSTLLQAADTEASVRTKVAVAAEVAARATGNNPKRLVFRYMLSPSAIVGDGHVQAIELVRNKLEFDADGRVVADRPTERKKYRQDWCFVRSATAARRFPFDECAGVIPNIDGRAIDPNTGAPLAGVYATGWIKRGPSGVIGSNKKCAIQTVDALLQDSLDGALVPPVGSTESLRSLVTERVPDAVDFAGWSRIDKAESDAGRANSRPRIKLVDTASMLTVARAE